MSERLTCAASDFGGPESEKCAGALGISIAALTLGNPQPDFADNICDV